MNNVARIAAGAVGVSVGSALAFQGWKRTSKATDQPVLSVGADVVVAAAFLGAALIAKRPGLHFAGTSAVRAGLIGASAGAMAMAVATAIVVNMEDTKGPLAGVYAPQRLKMLNPDVTVTGTVVHVKREGDGDDHINIIPDPDSRWTLAQHPTKFLIFHGAPQTELVTEETRNTRHSGELPQAKVGDHVRIRGPWVDDLVHNWNEIHPVQDIQVLKSAPD
ncbi:MAG: hypothetical protein H7287_14550 [Thermoleophilia bacterium]|nr:hypothetical protein [Thermoleophilia bacterium]